MISQHCKDQARKKGISLALIEDVLEFPSVTYASRRYPGQVKYCGQGICIAVRKGTGEALTVFMDREVTGLRQDQRRDKVAVEGQRNAARMAL